MHLLQPELHSRRAFLRRSSQLALSGTALPFALNLAAMGEAAAFEATDYKALVCVFMYGDAAGQAAGGIALARSDLAATLLSPIAALAGGAQYALHPSMSGLAGLFNNGRAAVQLNVGPLVVPLTKAQYSGSDRKTYPLPPKLFSHNDQQSIWQSSSPEGSTVGWGGNLGDLALSSNGNSLFTCINVTGKAVFLSGDSALSYQVSSGGAVAINGIKNNVYNSSAVKTALTTLVQQPRSHTLENEYNKVTSGAIGAEAKSPLVWSAATWPRYSRPQTLWPTSSRWWPG